MFLLVPHAENKAGVIPC